MRKNSLKASGLSLSQAQSVSNSCNQHAVELETVLSKVNNFSKTVKVDNISHTLQAGCPIPSDTISIIEEIGSLQATQAFLMENIKAKDRVIREIQASRYVSKPRPEMESYDAPALFKQVDEEWGWEQLDEGDINEYYDMEAKSAAIGKFIHKDGKLTKLRNELPNVPELEWMEVETGKKTPVIIVMNLCLLSLLFELCLFSPWCFIASCCCSPFLSHLKVFFLVLPFIYLWMFVLALKLYCSMSLCCFATVAILPHASPLFHNAP